MTSKRLPSLPATPSTPTAVPPSSPATPSWLPFSASPATPSFSPSTASSLRLASPPMLSPTIYLSMLTWIVRKTDTALEHYKQLINDAPFNPSPTTYRILIKGLIDNNKEKLGGSVTDGVVYGSLMKGYFLRGMEKEAMECYEEAVGENSKIRMNAVAFNLVLGCVEQEWEVR
ncbi:hypothetical protein F0562_026733 [Nyssa sinensis]|uniref:Pentacotripeptide-repeat region of PRORP domain-containing protein n=1 Tax=Nyssa sinensis TaxID=561372 RepID=A0A5J5BFU6_9ASTE|nr:hypothetical protein F0562_026733 [Nyssa sinensis]